jgi:hypothetical protein
MKNLLLPSEFALRNKTWGYGLSSYSQENCRVTLNDNGLRVYRPPNFDGASNNTTWGGLRIHPLNIDPYLLVKGRTYIVMFDVTGQTSNGISELYWTNQMGWGGGGLMPDPTNVSYAILPANFQGSKTCWYKFTIPDDIYKVCTVSYSGFTAGTTYPSYRDFAFGWGYSNTGSLGTDIYITNIRMYDLTETPTIEPDKNGILNLGALKEGFKETKFHISSEVYGNNFYEF